MSLFKIYPQRQLATRNGKEVTGLRDSQTRVIASESLARTSISFKDLPLLYETMGDLWIFR